MEAITYKDTNKGNQKAAVVVKRKEKFERKMEQKQKMEEMEKSGALEKKQKISQLKSVKKQRRRQADAEEWDNLQQEERLAKKLKRGLISLEEYNELVGDDLDLLESD